jgi:hypothetical protein
MDINQIEKMNQKLIDRASCSSLEHHGTPQPNVSLIPQETSKNRFSDPPNLSNKNTSPATAVMQPYIFPYLGYFSLIEASDSFIFYDDVNYIKKGWVNKNKILINGREHKFSVPVTKSSQNVEIKDTMLFEFERFSHSFLNTIALSYKKSSHYLQGMAYINSVLKQPHKSISELAISSITELYAMLGDTRDFPRSSNFSSHTKSTGQVERLISITQQNGHKHYINAIGGQQIYCKSDFKSLGVDISFLVYEPTDYYQPGRNEFMPGLSIIDVVMNTPLTQLKKLFQSYRLI